MPEGVRGSVWLEGRNAETQEPAPCLGGDERSGPNPGDARVDWRPRRADNTLGGVQVLARYRGIALSSARAGMRPAGANM